MRGQIRVSFFVVNGFPPRSCVGRGIDLVFQFLRSLFALVDSWLRCKVWRDVLSMLETAC